MPNPKGHEDSIKDSRFKAAWQSGATRTIRVPIALAEQLLEIAKVLDSFFETKTAEKLHDDSQMELISSGAKRFKKGISIENDPIEFYVKCCTVNSESEISGIELFAAYQKWAHSNGYRARNERFFLDAVAELGLNDGVVGIVKKGKYTLKNLALKAD